MRGKDDLDSLLDAALATYADPGQTDGLAERVLVSVRQARGQRYSNRWLLWVVPALAALALATFFILRRPAPAAHATRPPIDSRARELGKIEFNAAEPIRAHMAMRARRSIARHMSYPQALPKLEVFPTPTPLSEQERALAALMSRSPVSVGQSLAEAQKKIDAPIQLTAIQIPPINPPDQGGN